MPIHESMPPGLTYRIGSMQDQINKKQEGNISTLEKCNLSMYHVYLQVLNEMNASVQSRSQLLTLGGPRVE